MTPAISVQRGRGKGRNPWRIREFLSGVTYEEKEGLTMCDVARLAKVPPQVAQETIRGTRNHYRVLGVLESLGCPEELLYGRSAKTSAKMGRAA